MRHWVAHATIYQVNLRGIAAREPRNPIEAADEQPDGRTPLAYFTAHLDVIKRLGVSVLHIMPPFVMGHAQRKGIGSPYAAADYYGVDPEFGTLDEFRALLRAAHAEGFRLIIGMVPNHTSRDHVWIADHPEFYVSHENGEFAYDLDWSDTAKLDYTNPDLRAAMREVYRHWLNILGDDGVDGFRIDMAHFINDLSFWNETLPALRSEHASRELLFMAECYGREHNLDLFERGMNAAYDDDFYKFNEHFYALGVEGETVILPNEQLYNEPQWKPRLDLFRAGGLAAVMADALGIYEAVLPGGADAPRLARYTDNHDEGRGVFRFGAGAARAINQLIYLCPHTLPFMLCGQEFGALNRPSIHERIQACDKGYRQVTARGTSQKEGVEFEGNLFARGADNRAGWYRMYKDLLHLRNSTPELAEGDFKLLDIQEVCAPPERTVIAFERRLDAGCVRCAVNLGPESRQLGQADLLGNNLLYGQLEGDRLAPFGCVVVRCK